jgi:hypothetical protein
MNVLNHRYFRPIGLRFCGILTLTSIYLLSELHNAPTIRYTYSRQVQVGAEFVLSSLLGLRHGVGFLAVSAVFSGPPAFCRRGTAAFPVPASSPRLSPPPLLSPYRLRLLSADLRQSAHADSGGPAYHGVLAKRRFEHKSLLAILTSTGATSQLLEQPPAPPVQCNITSLVYRRDTLAASLRMHAHIFLG